MAPYFRSSEFWQCFVFWVWSLFELTIVCLHMISVSRTGLFLGCLLLITGALFLTKAFSSVLRWRVKNQDASKSPVVRIFLYSTGTLAVALQTVWFVIRTQ